MNKNSNRNLLLIIILTIISMACMCLPAGIKDKFSSSGSNDSESLLGEEYRSEQGGFSIQKVEGYTFEDVIGIINMIAPDAVPEVGPGIMVVGGLNENEQNNDDLVETLKQSSPTMEFSKVKKIKVDGVEGLILSVDGTNSEQEIRGKIVVVMVTPLQQFTMIGLAPTERWDEMEPAFDAVLDSVKFFEASPDAILEESWDEPESVMPTQQVMQNEPEAITDSLLVRQWAVAAQASSQYGDDSWAASQATGEPDVDECGDNILAWASVRPNSLEWINLDYATPVVPTEINIYQSYNPSQVVEVYIMDINGDEYIVWEGEPEAVSNCPDLMSITIELDESFLVDRLTIVVDQSIMGWGWAEIDAVELVGFAEGHADSIPSAVEPQTEPQPQNNDASTPSNYSGWMACPVYQGYLQVVPGKTQVGELDGLLGLTGKRSTDSWKPRDDHADTFIYDLGKDSMLAWISVTTEGVVYKKAISANTHPTDFLLATVTKDTYDQLDAIYKRDQVIPYAVMANTLTAPGFLSEQYLRKDDGKMVSTYQWFHANGDHMSGFFYDGMLTGMAGLVFIPK
ncbi:MAG: hypothetical protein CVU39_14905 [Chloroflexi bacterium HGW-Chloroflexi-10]|nr:MAG: hypothetical protein CVU39_14905 [Chloroflexi bacterium HGW-Chloroflexi-10]